MVFLVTYEPTDITPAPVAMSLMAPSGLPSSHPDLPLPTSWVLVLDHAVSVVPALATYRSPK